MISRRSRGRQDLADLSDGNSSAANGDVPLRMRGAVGTGRANRLGDRRAPVRPAGRRRACTGSALAEIARPADPYRVAPRSPVASASRNGIP